MLTNDFMLFPEKCALRVDADFMRPHLLLVWGGAEGRESTYYYIIYL